MLLARPSVEKHHNKKMPGSGIALLLRRPSIIRASSSAGWPSFHFAIVVLWIFCRRTREHTRAVISELYVWSRAHGSKLQCKLVDAHTLTGKKGDMGISYIYIWLAELNVVLKASITPRIPSRQYPFQGRCLLTYVTSKQFTVPALPKSAPRQPLLLLLLLL